MAWRSGGASNDELVDNLKRYDVIKSNNVERAFRAVDRCHFVPQDLLDMAYADRPLKESYVHISAPHMYASIVESLEIDPNSSLSFLNIGAGTGYLSCIVAHMIGRSGICYGVEIQKKAIEHCSSSMSRWRDSNEDLDLPHMNFVHGNGLQIQDTKGEGVFGFDRIYVGAGCDRKQLVKIAELLRCGGVLVAPVEDELVKVVRVTKGTVETKTSSAVPRSLQGQPPTLSDDYVQSVISRVTFSDILERPSISVELKSRVWEPSLHRFYPNSFRLSCKELLLCAASSTIQEQPIVVPKLKVNLASKLPPSIWMHILSYTHREWFRPPQSQAQELHIRCEEQQQALQAASTEKQEVEARLRLVERERDGYRLLALRCQSRLNRILNNRGMAQLSDSESEVLRNEVALDAFFNRLQGRTDEGDSDDEASSVVDMEDTSIDDDGSDISMEFASDLNRGESTLVAASPNIRQSSVDQDVRARAVSITSADP